MVNLELSKNKGFLAIKFFILLAAFYGAQSFLEARPILLNFCSEFIFSTNVIPIGNSAIIEYPIGIKDAWTRIWLTFLVIIILLTVY